MNAQPRFSPHSEANEPTSGTLPINPAHSKPSICSLLEIPFPKLRFFYCFRINSISDPLFRSTLTRSNGSLQNWVGSALEDLLFIRYDGELDQWSMTKGSCSDWPVSLNSYFSGYIYYKGYHLGSSFWQLLPAGPSDRVVYGSQQNYGCATINLNDKIHNKAPDYNWQDTIAACMPSVPFPLGAMH